MDVDASEFLSPPEKKLKLDGVCFGEVEKTPSESSGSGTDKSGITSESFGSGSSKSETTPESYGSGSNKSETTSESAEAEPSHDLSIGILGGSLLYDSEEEDYRVSSPDMRSYLKEVEESHGYDVSEYHGIANQGGIAPLCYLDSERIHFYSMLVNFAIREHNAVSGAQIQLVNIVKVNVECAYKHRMFITFEAKDGDNGDVKTYQTTMRRLNPEIWVDEFRLKPV